MLVAESASAVVERLSSESNTPKLAEYVSRLALAAADARDARFGAGPGEPAAPSVESPLTVEIAETPFGNLLTILRRGVQTSSEGAVLSALLALGIEPDLPSAPESELALAAKLVWLAAHTPADALAALDAAVGPKASVLWHAIAQIACDPVRVGHGMTRSEALIALAALRASTSEAAAGAAQEVRSRATDPLILALLDSAGSNPPELRGELASAPRGPAMTALLTITLILFLLQASRLIGKIAFAYRRPATLRLSERGLELEQRTEMLGRVLRDRSMVVPLANLARVTREVRYARAGMYAGLLALVLGSYFGMGLLVDGVRVPGGSPPLLGLSVLLMALGLLIDFGLSLLGSSAHGKCRLVVVPRKGRSLCIAEIDATRADAMLASLARAASR
jgi:hypothetical protein